jgi:2,3-dihydroxybenzoate decarboxylase
MDGKIGLEEHFAIPDTLGDSRGALSEKDWAEMRTLALDFQDRRLREMDKHGMELMLVSLNAPAVQAIPDPKKANEIARKANDYLAEQVRQRPDRFQGLAALPMQDPDMAVRELTRCIEDLGFKGALVNSYSDLAGSDNPLYYDLPQYLPFWEAIERLDVPFYLHPRHPHPLDSKIYEGHPWLRGPAWGFGQETAVHALRLMSAGIFDKHPRVQIVLGHLGENLPFGIWRVDNCNGWVTQRPPRAARKPMSDYFHANFHVSTSGNFHTKALHAAIAEMGVERVLFSVDWPFEDIGLGSQWFDGVDLSEADRRKIGRTNAIKLFKLAVK